MYVQDYDELSCPLVTAAPGDGGPTRTTWFALMQPYLKNQQIGECPSETPHGWTYPSGNRLYYDYSMHYYLGGMALAKINNPSECFVFGDGTWGDVTQYRLYIHGPWLRGGTYGHPPRFFKHNGGGNWVFCDGHGKWSKDYTHMPDPT